MSRTCVISRKPTRTSTGDAASYGTTWTNGVNGMASRNSAAVTSEATPVLAPSPTPEADSMKVVFDDADAAPPAAAASEPTSSTPVAPGKRAPAGRGGERGAQQHAVDAGQPALRVEQAALGSDADHGPPRVEEVGEHQRQHREQGRDDGDGEGAGNREVPDQREVRPAADAL